MLARQERAFLRNSATSRRRMLGLISALLLFGWTVPAVAFEGAVASVKRVAMIGFTVSDMERSVAFYERVLGFERVAELQVTGGEYDSLQGVFASNMRIVHMKLGEQTLDVAPKTLMFGMPMLAAAFVP